MAKNPDTPKKPVKTPKSKASRPDVQPIGPALAELLNPAINRGDAGMGSGTGLKPPPDNSWDRRAGGEAAAHRARASTKGSSGEVAKRDAALSPPPVRRSPLAKPDGGEGSGAGGRAANSLAAGLAETPPTPDPSPPRARARGGRGVKSIAAARMNIGSGKHATSLSRRGTRRGCGRPVRRPAARR